MSDTDPEVAERLARERIVESLYLRSESQSSDLAKLGDSIWEIYSAIEDGEEPDTNDIELARIYLEEIEERLDDVAALFGWHRWETGVRWGKLTEEEQAEIQERDGRDWGRLPDDEPTELDQRILEFFDETDITFMEGDTIALNLDEHPDDVQAAIEALVHDGELRALPVMYERMRDD